MRLRRGEQRRFRTLTLSTPYGGGRERVLYPGAPVVSRPESIGRARRLMAVKTVLETARTAGLSLPPAAMRISNLTGSRLGHRPAAGPSIRARRPP
jgi:hypothetical protein